MILKKILAHQRELFFLDQIYQAQPHVLSAKLTNFQIESLEPISQFFIILEIWYLLQGISEVDIAQHALLNSIIGDGKIRIDIAMNYLLS